MPSRFENKSQPVLTDYQGPNISEGVFRRGDLKSTGQGMIDFAKGVADMGQAEHAKEMAAIKNQGAMMELGMGALKMVAGKAQQGMKQAEAEAETSINYQVNPSTGEMTAVGPGDGAFAGMANMMSGGGIGEDFLGGFLGGGNSGASSASIFEAPQEQSTASVPNRQEGQVTPAGALGMSVVSASPAALKTRVENDLFTAANEQFKSDPDGLQQFVTKYAYNLRTQFPNKAGLAVADHAMTYGQGLFRGVLQDAAQRTLNTNYEDIKARLSREGENLQSIARTYPGDDFEQKVAGLPAYQAIETLTGDLSNNPAFRHNMSPETRQNFLDQAKQDAVNNWVVGRAIAIRDQKGVDAAVKWIEDKTINSTSPGKFETKEAARNAAVARVNYYTEQQKSLRDASNKEADRLFSEWRSHGYVNASQGDLMKYRDSFRKNYAPEAAAAMEAIIAVRGGPIEAAKGLPAVKALETIMGNGPQVAMERGFGSTKVSLENPAAAFDKREQLNLAAKEKHLTAQEMFLYEEHLGNLWDKGGVDNPDGSRSTVKNTIVRNGNRYYNVPTVWDGKEHSDAEAKERALKRGIDNYPSDTSAKRLDARYLNDIHPYFEKDAEQYRNYQSHKSGQALPSMASGGNPAQVAESLLGKNENTHRQEIQNFLSANGHGQSLVTGENLMERRDAWCAAFTGAALEKAGFKSLRSNIATDYMNWGQPQTGQVRAGDVVVLSRGKKAGELGGHVGLATGNMRGDKIEVISGNAGDKVSTTWESRSEATIRTAGPNDLGSGQIAPASGSGNYPRGGVGRRPFDPSNVNHYLDVTKGIENPTGNPAAVSPTGARGDFQFISSTWAKYALPGYDINNPQHNREAAGRLAIDNYNHLKRSLGRDVSEAEVYLAHQQGAAGAAALLKHPEMNAVQALIAGGIPLKKAEQAIRVNGGNGSMTAGEFANKWITRFETGKSAPGGYSGPQNAAYVNGAGAASMMPPGSVPMTQLPTMAPPMVVGTNSNIPFSADQIAANPFLISAWTAKLEADDKRHLDQIKQTMPMVEQLLRSGIEPDDKLVAGAIQFSDAHPEYNLGLREKFQAISDASKDAFRLQGKDSQEYVDRVIRKAVESPSIYMQNYAEEIQKQVTAAATLAKNDPHKFAVASGLTSGQPLKWEASMTPQIYGEGVTPMDVLKTSIEQRRIAGEALKNNTGLSAIEAAFPDNDMKSLSNMLAMADGPTAQTILGGIAASLKPEEFSHFITQKDFKQSLLGLARSPDPSKAIAGYGFMEAAYQQNALIFDEALKGEKEQMARFMSDVRFLGPDNAMKMRLAEKMNGSQGKVYDERMAEAKKITKDFRTDYVINKLDLPNAPGQDTWSRLMNNSGNGMFSAISGDDTPISPKETDFASASVLTQAYKDTVERYMAAGNTQAVAEDEAAHFLRQNYAKSKFNEGRVMAYAPELKYQTPAEQAAFGAQVNLFVNKVAMENGIQLDSAVPFSPMGNNSAMVIADQKTAIEMRTPGLHPSYMLQVRSNGQLHLLYDKETGEPLRFRFNPENPDANVEDSRNAISSAARNSMVPF